MIMWREVYYVHLKVLCSYIIAIFRIFSSVCNVRGNVFLAVEGCLNGVLGHGVGYGKSPCFSGLGFLTTTDVDAGVSIFGCVDGVENFE